MNIANFCEIDPLAPREKHVTRTKLPETKNYTLSEFHKDLNELTKGPKKGVIRALCLMLSQHGDFAEFGAKYPEAYQRLRDMQK